MTKLSGASGLLWLAMVFGNLAVAAAEDLTKGLARAKPYSSSHLLASNGWLHYDFPRPRSFFEKAYDHRLEDECEPQDCEHRRPGEYRAEESKSNGLLFIKVNGGLNQQRRGLVNGVTVARLLNATLVVPTLVKHQFWQDTSSFEDLYDVDNFIQGLQEDIRLVRTLTPEQEEFMTKRRRQLSLQPHSRVSAEWFLEHALPILKKFGFVVFPAFHRHLAADLDPALQRVRCRANYHALRFAAPIRSVASSALQQVKAKGPFIAVHLRFEPDWFKHTGCKQSQQREESKCPISPLELAMILKAFGVDNKTMIYIATGNRTAGAKAFAPLYEAFPEGIVDKYSLLGDAMDQFVPYANRMAAIDHMVCAESDFLLLTAGSNFATMLRGERFYRNVRQESLLLRLTELTHFFSGSPRDMDTLRVKLDKRREARQKQNYLAPRQGGHFFDRPWECVCKEIPQKYLSSDSEA